MGRTANTPKTENVVQTTETDAAVSANTTGQKTKKILVKELLRGSYGAFNPGDVVEVPEHLATAFINANLAEVAKKKE
ncbi:MAG: hypothetical protein K6F15_04055 [Treponema sp.]|nr:hypothetical protein [Treponema sp.]